MQPRGQGGWVGPPSRRRSWSDKSASGDLARGAESVEEYVAMCEEHERRRRGHPEGGGIRDSAYA